MSGLEAEQHCYPEVRWVGLVEARVWEQEASREAEVLEVPEEAWESECGGRWGVCGLCVVVGRGEPAVLLL